MAAYAVLEASGPRQWEWPKDSGQFNHDWTLKLQGVEKPAILTIKPNTPPPEPGHTMDLTLEVHPKFEDKLKARRQGQGGMFGGARPEDPARARRIVRQHSQEMSVRLYLGLVAQGAIDAPASASEAFERVKALSDAFERDAMGEGS
jgi:hypothetical protein